jgi:DNA (cytosine-5)-methyltransferase 1
VVSQVDGLWRKLAVSRTNPCYVGKMRQPRVVSLFSGAGGLDFGFEAAGFRTTVAVEMNHDCCETLRANRSRVHVIERSIFDVPTEEMLEASDVKPGEIDLVVGGPPCQPFSKAGYWARGDAARLDDPRANTLSAYLRVIEQARPRAFLLENVEGLAYSGKDEGLKLLLDGIARINRRTKSAYAPVLQVLNAADYGVPQLRERVIIIASRDGAQFKFPEPTHHGDEAGAQSSLFAKAEREPHRTAWDALADVEPSADEDLAVRGKWADLLPSIPEGNNYLWHTERGGGRPLFGWRRRYWTFLLKLAKARPSWTIQAQPGPAVGPFHWKNRRLSMRELCRLQTFPDDVLIHGGRTSVQRQVGNAVPSLLAEVLGRAIRVQLLGLPAMRAPLRLLPPRRAPVPAAEAHTDVPKKFRALEGKHSAHPGTGMGTRARERVTSQDAS